MDVVGEVGRLGQHGPAGAGRAQQPAQVGVGVRAGRHQPKGALACRAECAEEEGRGERGREGAKAGRKGGRGAEEGRVRTGERERERGRGGGERRG